MHINLLLICLLKLLFHEKDVDTSIAVEQVVYPMGKERNPLQCHFDSSSPTLLRSVHAGAATPGQWLQLIATVI